ncbi:extended synaptotagmin-1-like [Harmonia axyridis]|uniref:extended synaptotagmin-1-like n=1 Tax=Harmonia axyridis TaxID=115357 RepID=UPI001E27995E|nr:extended synaptotagmin-1-like [Harmonia axyridis]
MSVHSDPEFQVASAPCPPPSAFQSYLRVIFSLIWKSTVACCFYYIGYKQWSIIWVALPVLADTIVDIFAARYARKRNRAKMRGMADEKDLIRSHFKELPAWVFFPDVERVEWVNSMLRQMWPTVNNYARSYMLETLEPELKTTMDYYMLKGFHFQKIELGFIPPKITGVKVYDRTGRNEIILDLYLFYGGDCEVTFGLVGVTAGIKDFQIEGGIKYFFIDDPDIDFVMTGVTGLLEVPGLRNKFRQVIESVVNSMYVLPNMCVIDLSDNPEVISYLRTPNPKGVLRVFVVAGKKLISQDINGLSDPFVIIKVGSDEHKTQTINYSLNPVWNFHCEFIITELQGQKVTFHVWDEDYAKHDSLGHCSYEISSVKDAKYVDTWLILEEVSHGSIHVEFMWFNLCRSLQDLQNTLEDNHTFPGEPFNSAVLVVFIDSATELPMKNGFPNPLVELTVGTVTKKTQECVKTANPRWDEGFCFLVVDPNNSYLKLKVMDGSANKQIGYFEFSINTLLKHRHLKIRSQPFKLTKSGENSEIVMSASLKIMTINDVTISQIFILVC